MWENVAAFCRWLCVLATCNRKARCGISPRHRNHFQMIWSRARSFVPVEKKGDGIRSWLSPSLYPCIHGKGWDTSAGEMILEVLSSMKEEIIVQVQICAELPPPCPVLGAIPGDSPLCQVAETKPFRPRTQCFPEDASGFAFVPVVSYKNKIERRKYSQTINTDLHSLLLGIFPCFLAKCCCV